MRILAGIMHFFSVAADWLLIVTGALLLLKALTGIDVALARYVIMAAGAVIMAAGLWYRRRRLRRP